MPFAKPVKAPVNTLAAPRLAAQPYFGAVEMEEEPQADVSTQLSQATKFGHSLTNLQPIQRQVGAESELDEEEETPIQAKLTIGQPGDKYEQEADRMAAKVMAMPDSTVQQEAIPEEEDELQAKPQLRREAMPEEDEALQMKPQLQRQTALDDDDETLQTKTQNSKLKTQNSKSPSLQAKGKAPSVPVNFDSQLAQHNGSGHPLSDETRAFMEPRFGADFSNVRVHETPDLANAIQAQAFTHGQDIYFNSGKYNPGSSRGKELLAHELTHVVQQNQWFGINNLRKRPSTNPKKKRSANFRKQPNSITHINFEEGKEDEIVYGNQPARHAADEVGEHFSREISKPADITDYSGAIMIGQGALMLINPVLESVILEIAGMFLSLWDLYNAWKVADDKVKHYSEIIGMRLGLHEITLLGSNKKTPKRVKLDKILNKVQRTYIYQQQIRYSGSSGPKLTERYMNKGLRKVIIKVNHHLPELENQCRVYLEQNLPKREANALYKETMNLWRKRYYQDLTRAARNNN